MNIAGYMEKKFYKKIILVCIFTIAFAWVEASVVAYLRAIYYPQGFQFPIKRHYDIYLVIEFIREFATIVIMLSISSLLSKKFWEGFGYFLIVFGVWDVFYYIWLKAAINWPASIWEPDILFLIPIPWIGPVLAPVLVSLVMIAIGIDITKLFNKGFNVKPRLKYWIAVIIGSLILLYSFMSDIDAAFYETYPKPYNWFLLVIALALFASAYLSLHRETIRRQ
jgi:hypothetical protein